MEFATDWPTILHQLSQLKPRVIAKVVLWELPLHGWRKYNTNGASRGNPGSSSWAFCLRDVKGDLIYAEGATIEDTDNMVAEAEAIMQATYHCSHSGQEKIIIQIDSLAM